MKSFAPIVRGNSRLEVRSEKDAYELILIGPVGGSWFSDDGIKESEVRDALKSIPKGRQINVHINSEGGSVQEGLGIYNAFRARSKDITAYVDGYALSIASVFPLAAGKVVSPKSAIWMIHKAWSFAQGNSDDMEDAAKMLEEHDEVMAEIYAEETGKPIQEMRDAMAAETWIRGSAAVDFGLADETDDEDADASAYRPLPAAYLNKLKPSEAIKALFQGGLRLSPAAGVQQGSANTKTNSAGAPGGAQIDKIMKDKVIALLKKHGTEAKEDWTEAQFDEAISKFPAPAPKAEIKDKDKTIILDLAALQEQIKAEKLARITSRADALIVDLRLTNDEREDAIARAMADEKYLDVIARRPQAKVGGDPVGGVGHSISAQDPILDLKKKHSTAKARFEVMTKDWDQIMAQAVTREARRGVITDEFVVAMARAGRNPFALQGMQYPQAANTITSVLTNFLIDGSVTDLQNMWAPLRAYTLDVRPDGYKPLAPGILKHVTVGSTAQTNPTTYESGNNTVAPVTITPAEHSVSYSISNTDLNSGVRMADLVRINTANFANVVVEAANVPISIANFGQAATQVFGGAATLVSAPAAFGFSDLATLQAALKKSPIKNIILDGSYIARVSNTPAFFQLAGVVGGNPNAWSAFGWNGIYQLTDWTGAAPNAQGFACNPQAIGGIIGLPLLPPVIPGSILSSTVVTIDMLDIQILAEAWFNPNTRTLWNSLRVMDGWAAVDKTAGFIVTSQ